MGLCSFAPTPGALALWPGAAEEAGGGAAPAPREGAAFVAHDVATLAAVSEALSLPGNPNLRHELTQASPGAGRPLGARGGCAGPCS